MERLNVVPFKMEDKGIRLKTSDWKIDLQKQIDDFKPNLLAISSTEDMWELGMKILRQLKNYKIKNNVPVIAGGVFSTFAPEICIKEELGDLFFSIIVSSRSFFEIFGCPSGCPARPTCLYLNLDKRSLCKTSKLELILPICFPLPPITKIFDLSVINLPYVSIDFVCIKIKSTRKILMKLNLIGECRK